MLNARILAVSVAISALAACVQIPLTWEAREYSASSDNIQVLKSGGDFTVKVGTFSSGEGTARIRLRLRKGTNFNDSSLKDDFVSPCQNSFSAYLAEAIKQELSLANKLSSNADVEVSGMLMQNAIYIPVFNGAASSQIEARFIVRKGGDVRYDKVKSARHAWPSGGYPLSATHAKDEYPVMVQKLLAKLYADSAFINALK